MPNELHLLFVQNGSLAVSSVHEGVRMSLSSVGNPAWETIRGVRFAMLYGSTLVPVMVTHAALDDMERAPREVGGYLAFFNNHRDALEQIASAKHQRGVGQQR